MIQLRFPLRRSTERMVKPRWSFYNALMLAAAVALMIGCGGKPTPPPPGAAEETPPTEVEMGDASNTPSPTTGEPTPSSPADEKPPADASGTK
jgi:hypothetical protein